MTWFFGACLLYAVFSRFVSLRPWLLALTYPHNRLYAFANINKNIMTVEELNQYFAGLEEELMDGIPDIIAETATEYYKESFSLKEFDGNPWEALKKPKKKGSFMITSGNLLNSIHPAEVSRTRVVIQAGDDKVTYAQAHNEGFARPVTIPTHTRRTKKGSTEVKAYTIQQNIP